MLYAITDSSLQGGQLLSQCQSALAGGTHWLQYRDKSQNHSKRLKEASALQRLCQQYGAHLIINDDLELALAVGAKGVHLGQDDGSIAQARQALGPAAIIGSTCHDQIALAHQAIKEGASYVAFGRFFPSKTKPNATSAPLSLLSEAKALDTHITTIGGISLHNASQLISAGASSIAVCHSLFACDNVEQRARDFCQLFNA